MFLCDSGIFTLSVDPSENGDPKVAVLFGLKTYAALNSLCGSITNFFGTPASNSP
jgi:hypothetical protein